jgi:hypothetical protein
MVKHIVPNLPASTLYILSEVEAKHYLYGLPLNHEGHFIACSSPNMWVKPTGPEAYLDLKELSPLGTHKLTSKVWEGVVGPAMDAYLHEKQVQCTVLLPVRMGLIGQPSSPIIMVGVNHSMLSAVIGIGITAGCQSILSNNGIDDMHIIIHESRFHQAMSLYRHARTSNPITIVHEPFSTTLGIPICNAVTPNLEGTAGVTEVPRCTLQELGQLIAQLPQLSMWRKRDSKMKAISEFSVVFMQV